MKPRRCYQCGADMLPPERGRVPYRSGLPHTFLDGVMVSRCSSCDDYQVDVPNVEGLHQLIADHIASRAGDLVPEEIRFLRKHLGWSQKDFAHHFKVDHTTVSKWETGAQNMNIHAQMLLKILAKHGPLKTDYILDCYAAEKGSARPAIEAKLADNEEWALKPV